MDHSTDAENYASGKQKARDPNAAPPKPVFANASQLEPPPKIRRGVPVGNLAEQIEYHRGALSQYRTDLNALSAASDTAVRTIQAQIASLDQRYSEIRAGLTRKIETAKADHEKASAELDSLIAASTAALDHMQPDRKTRIPITEPDQGAKKPTRAKRAPK